MIMSAQTEDVYPPHISLQTALSICGTDLVEASGRISGMAISQENLKLAINRHVLSDVKKVMAKLSARIAEYEAKA